MDLANPKRWVLLFDLDESGGELVFCGGDWHRGIEVANGVVVVGNRVDFGAQSENINKQPPIGVKDVPLVWLDFLECGEAKIPYGSISKYVCSLGVIPLHPQRQKVAPEWNGS